MKKALSAYILFFLFIPVFIFGCTRATELQTVSTPAAEYDLIVVGSDPEGIAAAVSGARNGLSTLLVDHRNRVGGLYTVGQLNSLDLNYKSDRTKEIINKGIFSEFHQAVGGGAGFDIQTAQKVFEDMLAKAGVQVMLEATFKRPVLDGNKLTAIEVTKNGKQVVLQGKRFIDATQDGDVAAASGVPFTVAREDMGLKNKYAAATLMFTLKGINWAKVYDYLENDKSPYTGASDKAAWGYEQMFKYQAKDPNVQIRGLNIGRQKDGTTVINALQIFNVNPLDEKAKQEAILKARAELPGIIEFMRANCPGFEKAELVGTAEELYIRESRHIAGEATLTGEDVFENRYREDGIAYGSYPIDIQASVKGQTGSALNGINPYSIPFGTLVPLKVEHLLVVGKAASFDTLAHGSARTVPVGMATGQAAGVAAKYSIDQNKTFREINKNLSDIKNIKEMLTAQGVDLTPIIIDLPEKKSWSYPYIKELRSKGMLSKGYYNNYKIDERAGRLTFYRIFTLINYNSNLTIDMNLLKELPDPPAKGDVLKLVNQILKTNYESFAALAKAGVIDGQVLAMVDRDDVLTNGEIYGIIAGMVKKMEANNLH